jgi:hypothetical protein
MKEFNFAVFLSLSRAIEGLIAHTLPIMAEREIDADVRSSALQFFTLHRPNCIELGLELSTMTIDKIVRVLNEPTSTFGEYRPLLLELQGRLVDEAVAIRFFQISVRDAEYYDQWFDDWKEVFNRFPATTSDVEEASKCFALARYAASVFHSTQIIELGLLELGQLLKVSDPKSGYSAVTKELKRILDKKYPELTDFERANRPFLEQIYGTTEALKNAWRNKIGHAQGRLILLSADFTPEIAEEILIASRAFMRRLADEMPS